MQLLRAFRKLNSIKNKKVVGHYCVKFYALQLLFGFFFRYLLSIWSYKGKTIMEGMGFCQIRGVLGSYSFDHRI